MGQAGNDSIAATKIQACKDVIHGTAEAGDERVGVIMKRSRGLNTGETPQTPQERTKDGGESGCDNPEGGERAPDAQIEKKEKEEEGGKEAQKKETMKNRRSGSGSRSSIRIPA